MIHSTMGHENCLKTIKNTIIGIIVIIAVQVVGLLGVFVFVALPFSIFECFNGKDFLTTMGLQWSSFIIVAKFFAMADPFIMLGFALRLIAEEGGKLADVADAMVGIVVVLLGMETLFHLYNTLLTGHGVEQALACSVPFVAIYSWFRFFAPNATYKR